MSSQHASSRSGFPAPPPQRRGADAARYAWWSFGLAFVPPLTALLAVAGVGVERFGFVGVPAVVLCVVFAVIAIGRRSQPRWPAIIALVMTGVYLVVFAGFAVWALLGLTQLMFAPTY